MRVRVAIWFAAALSGGAALCYEICWTRALVVPLGNSADASAVVLAGFMLGMAVGARVGGGFAERTRSPLLLYAALEALLGGIALIAPYLLNLLSRLATGIGVLGTGVRHTLALLLITIPCLGLGATLPILVRALTREKQSLGFQIGLAYGANTLGAACGALWAGFWGIPKLGVWACSAVAASASLGATTLALLVAFLTKTQHASPPEEQEAQADSTTPQLRRAALVAGLLVGFAMLACEVLWGRLITFVFGHDTYAFAALLAFVLLGLSLGGFLQRLAAGFEQARVLPLLLGGFGLSVLLSFWAGGALVVRWGREAFTAEAGTAQLVSAWQELRRVLLYTPILVLIPSMFAGALYPTACSLYGSGARDAGRRTGVFGLVNGIGSALGAALSALGLVSLLGLQGAFLALACLAIAIAGATALLRKGERWKRLLTAAGLVGSLLCVALALPPQLPRQMLLKAVGDQHQTLLFYEEGRTGTVSVTQNKIQGEKILWMNAVNEVTTRLVHDQSFKVLGHLGPLLHPNPRKAVMICLGAGLSAGATILHPVSALDVVDLSSTIPRAARHFALENNHVQDQPAFHLHAGDGRQFLLSSAGGYDLAIIDSTHPKAVDSWILYTREFYDLVRQRLAHGGIVVQWLPLHGLSEREFKIVVRTFLAAFPDMTLWANAGYETYGQVGYAKLVGIKDAPLEIDLERLARRLEEPRLQADLAPWGLASVEEILDLFLGGSEAVRAWTEGLPVQTDNRPLVPYTTEYSTGRRMEPSLLLAARSQLLPFLRSPEPGSLERIEKAREAQGLVLAGRLERALELRPEGTKLRRFLEQTRTIPLYYKRLADLYPTDDEKLFEAGTQLGALGYPREALPLYEHALRRRPKDFRLQLNLALLLLGQGQSARAIGILSKLRAERPGSSLVLHNLGAALASSGDPEAAVRTYQEALAWDPGAIGTQLALAQLLLAKGDLKRVKGLAEQVLTVNPWIGEAQDLLGLVAERQGDPQRAIEHYRQAIIREPYQAMVHHHLGLVLQAVGALEPAEQAHQTAVRLEPNKPLFRVGLAKLRSAQKRFAEAEELSLLLLESEPDNALAAHQLGVALRGQGKTREAIEAFCLALRLDPSLTSSREQVAQLGGRVDDPGCSRLQ